MVVVVEPLEGVHPFEWTAGFGLGRYSEISDPQHYRGRQRSEYFLLHRAVTYAGWEDPILGVNYTKTRTKKPVGVAQQ
jgi:hypothetical protein